jgi:dihydroorotate dehydrogenase electron transfer subunit
MKQALCTITSNVEVMPGIYLMWIEAPNIACSVQPGQFITVRCGDFTLRRPLSVHRVSSPSLPLRREDSGSGEIALLFKVAGKGTLWLSQRQTGDGIDILGPLGNGFSIETGAKNLLLVAGGIGIAPLFFLMQRASSQHQVTLIHGASTAAQLYPFSPSSLTPDLSPSEGVGKGKSEERSKLPALPNGVQFIPVTEDGSRGEKGTATDILRDFLDWADQVYACGPVDMYKAIALIAPKCQVSLEVRMGCGFGACYGCTINTKNGLKQVCRDGPVFELEDIIWQEVRI